MRSGMMIGIAVLATVGLGNLLAPRIRSPGRACGFAHAESAPPDKSGVKSLTLAVDGMTCGACAVTVRVALKKLDGVKDAKVSVPNKQAVVEYDPVRVTPQQIVDAINRAGYKASLPSS